MDQVAGPAVRGMPTDQVAVRGGRLARSWRQSLFGGRTEADRPMTTARYRSNGRWPGPGCQGRVTTHHADDVAGPRPHSEQGRHHGSGHLWPTQHPGTGDPSSGSPRNVGRGHVPSAVDLTSNGGFPHAQRPGEAVREKPHASHRDSTARRNPRPADGQAGSTGRNVPLDGAKQGPRSARRHRVVSDRARPAGTVVRTVVSRDAHRSSSDL